MPKRKHKRKHIRFLMDTLDLPAETLPGVPKVTMLGRDTVLVENHKGILEYGPGCVRLITALGVLRIGGTELELLQLGSELVTVTGRTDSIMYEE